MTKRPIAEKAKANLIRVASTEEMVVVMCLFCEHEISTTGKHIFRGISVTCEKCGSHLETLPKSTKTLSKVSLDVRYKGSKVTVRIIRCRDAVWFFLDDAEASIIDNLDHDSDRAVAVIAGSMIENRIKRALLCRMRRNQAIETRLFQPSGPLGSFSAKIDLAYLAGLISDEAYQDLITLKVIRNFFAHNLNIQDFRSQQIKDNAANLKLVDSFVAETSVMPDGKLKSLDLGLNAKPVIFIKHADQVKKQARYRYLLTVQLFAIRFAPCELPNYPLPMI